MDNILKSFKLFTKNNGLVTGNITLDDFNHIFSFNDEELAKKVEEDEPNYKYGLSFNEYLYSCFSSYNNGLDSDNDLLNGMAPIKNKYRKKVEYVFNIHMFLENNLGYSLVDFEIDDELLSRLNENINPNYTTEKKILYYYFKMCMLLEIDDKYVFSNVVSKYHNNIGFKKSSNRLSSINSNNNRVSCFEFDAILSQLISKEGGVVKISPFSGTSAHVFTEAIIDGRYYRFDAFESPVGDYSKNCDLVNVKLGDSYCGVCANEEDLLDGQLTHYNYIDEVYQDVLKEMSFDSKKFNSDSLEYCFSAIDSLDVNSSYKRKIRSRFLEFNEYPLVNSGAYYSALVRKNNVDDDVLKLVGVASTIKDYGLGFVLSVRQDNGEYIYFYFGEDDDISIFDQEEMTDFISENKIIIAKKETVYEDKYRFIPGVDSELQQSMNYDASLFLLPRLFDKIYRDSYENGDSAKKFSKKVDN